MTAPSIKEVLEKARQFIENGVELGYIRMPDSPTLPKIKAALATLSQPTADRREIVARPTAFLAWAVEMFGSVAKLRSERLMRFVEEAIELAHADNMDRTTFDAIANRVYSRPKGDVPKEIGQVQACLEMFAENIGLSSADEAEREFQRVQSIPQDEWQRRHGAKQAIGIAALDGGSK